MSHGAAGTALRVGHDGWGRRASVQYDECALLAHVPAHWSGAEAEWKDVEECGERHPALTSHRGRSTLDTSPVSTRQVQRGCVPRHCEPNWLHRVPKKN